MWLLNAEGIKGVRVTIRGTLLAGGINFLLNILLIPLLGLSGALIATSISSVILYVYFTNQLRIVYL
jgi:O-antigen/teichoic acid export membrane protein